MGEFVGDMGILIYMEDSSRETLGNSSPIMSHATLVLLVLKVESTHTCLLIVVLPNRPINTLFSVIWDII